MTAKKTRIRGEHHARIKQAIETLQDHYDRDGVPSSLGAIAEEIADWYREEEGRDWSPDSLAKSLDRHQDGRNIVPETHDLLVSFFEAEKPNFIAPVDIEECFLDLKKFFYVRDGRFSERSRQIEGTYQTYALATSINQIGRSKDEQYIRRGSITFSYDKKTNRLTVKERQYRQQTEEFDEYELKWSGYGCPIDSSSYVASMRTERPHEKSTPLFYMFWGIIRDQKLFKVREMMANSIGFDPDNTVPTFPRIYMERIVDESKAHHDFVKASEITRKKILERVIL